MRRYLGAFVLASLSVSAPLAQQVSFSLAPEGPSAETIARLAEQLIPQYREENRLTYLTDVYRLYLGAGRYADAAAAIAGLRDQASSAGADPALRQQAVLRSVPFDIYAQARGAQRDTGLTFEQAYDRSFRDVFQRLSDSDAVEAAWIVATPVSNSRQALQTAMAQARGKETIPLADAVRLVNAYVGAEVYRLAARRIAALLDEDDRRRFIIDENVLITTRDGTTLSAVMARGKDVKTPQPTALLFNIYTDVLANRVYAKRAVLRGYVGIVGDTHGKRLSSDPPVPWEHDANDTYAVIDWISRQPWSDGQVGMYGGSYSGFSQWAAAKTLHPALKTIVPVVAANPGLGLPMQNNVFQFSNYAWNFYVANNKTLDEDTYGDVQRWNALGDRLFASGRPYREVDLVDGTANPILQRQLRHPSYYDYWQRMTPFKAEFSRIRIPVLSIAGYFDDSQVSSVQYLKDHYAYRNDAEHYLVIGPYDHFGTQAAVKPAAARGYAIDPVAQFDTNALTFDWLDYVMRRGPKPALLKDKINYQVMGANVWRHSPTIAAMSNQTLTLHFTAEKEGAYYRMRRTPSAKGGFVEQAVDLADRSSTNNDFPNPVLRRRDFGATGPSFVSDPFDEPVSVSGALSGVLSAAITSRDFDFSVALYELRPDGSVFNLMYYLGRASYSKDMTVRRLLKPDRIELLPFDRTPLTSRQMAAGSRLLVRLNVNKNPFAQINYGTGKDVSDESVADALEPLRVRWSTDSYIRVPVSR